MARFIPNGRSKKGALLSNSKQRIAEDGNVYKAPPKAKLPPKTIGKNGKGTRM